MKQIKISVGTNVETVPWWWEWWMVNYVEKALDMFLKKFRLIFSIYSTDIMKLNKFFLKYLPKINESMSTQNLYIIFLKIFIKW